MEAVADRAPVETTEIGDFEVFVSAEVGSCPDGELVERLLAAERARARLDATVVAVLDRFDGRTVWAGDGARSTADWVTQRVGVSYGQAKAETLLARDLRCHRQISVAFGAGRLTQAQARALLRARAPGLEEMFDVCEQILIDEVATATLAAGQRFLRRWVQEMRGRFGIPAPDGPEPEGAMAGRG